MKYEYPPRWIVPQIYKENETALWTPQNWVYNKSSSKYSGLKSNSTLREPRLPDGFLNSDLPDTSKTDSPFKNKLIESTPTTPLLDNSNEPDHTQSTHKIKPRIYRKLPEKRPRTREIPRKILNSVEKPEMKVPIKVTKDESSKEENKHPNTSSGTSPKTLLSLRKDVVYKTLIRSLKRYLTEKCDLTIDSFWTKKEKEITFFDQIDKLFVTEYSHKFDKSESNRPVKVIIHDRTFMRVDKSNVFNPENLKIYLWLIIIPELIKPYLKNQKRRCQQKLIYDCLYKYSHKKLDKLLESEFFCFLFQDYVESGAFKEMIESDETLSKHKSTYQEAWDYFISKIES